MTHPTEQIEAALTGGLTESEQTAFDEHVAGCPACARLLAEAKTADAAMNELFAGHRPDDDFEERMILNIRRRQVRITHPLVRRIAVGVAASIVLGGIGYVASPAINQRVGTGNSGLADDRTSARLYEHNAGKNVLLDSTINMEQTAAAPPDPQGGAVAGETGTPPAFEVKSNRDFAFRNPSPPVSGKVVSHGRVAEAEARFDPGSFQAGVGFDKQLNTFQQGGGGIGAGGGGGAGAEDLRRTAGNTAAYWVEPMADGVKSPAFGAAKPPNGPGKVEELTKDGKEASASYFKISQGGSEAQDVTSSKDLALGLVGGLTMTPPALKSSLNTADIAASDKAEGKPVSKESKALEESVKRVEEDAERSKSSVATIAAPDANKGDHQAPAAEAPPAPPAVEPAHQDVLAKPKIIRTGEMEFEVDSFDSTVGIIYKVIAEEQGYISTTNSDKLANGKVKGSVVLRVPAEHLDTLVLKLRGIGDLRSQHINAQDITKQFTDTESALRAAKAMQERLLDIIKNGKGAVKDLLEAEKQLGTWREKVEQLEGEIRYYSNQVSMSTLTLTLFERDIRQPALASETETVTMALETDKVEDAYAKAKDAVAQAKGRIVNSELKQFDAGQFGGTITAQVPPDAADTVIGRIKQLDGRIARFERQRNQTTSNGNAPADGRLSGDPIKVKREDVTINLTLYNLANVAPRRTTTMTVVAPDVEKSYHALIEQVRSAGGRVITSQINRGKEDQVAGAVNFNVPMEKADALLAALHGFGEVLKTETAESPDTQNVTESKRGFNVTIGSLSAFPARETQQIQLAAVAVPDAFNDLLNALRTGAGRIIASRLNDDRGNANATLEFEIRRDAAGPIEQAMNRDGQLITRLVNRSTDTDNTVDSKLHISLAIASSEQLPPRQITEMSVEVSDVQKAMDDLQAAALSTGGRQVDNPAITQGDGGQTIATLTLDVPLDKVTSLVDAADSKGMRKSRRTSIDSHAPEGKLARARLQITFATPATLTGNDGGALAGIRSGLGTSVRGLSYSLTLIVIGLCLVAPWALLIGIIWRAVKWARKSRTNGQLTMDS